MCNNEAAFEALDDIYYYAERTFPLLEGEYYWGIVDESGNLLCIKQTSGEFWLQAKGIPWIRKDLRGVLECMRSRWWGNQIDYPAFSYEGNPSIAMVTKENPHFYQGPEKQGYMHVQIIALPPIAYPQEVPLGGRYPGEIKAFVLTDWEATYHRVREDQEDTLYKLADGVLRSITVEEYERHLIEIYGYKED